MRGVSLPLALLSRHHLPGPLAPWPPGRRLAMTSTPTPSSETGDWQAPRPADFDAFDRVRSFARVAATLGLATEAPRIGPYPIFERIGSGGMGVVYSGLDRSLGRRVAVKVLHRPDDPEMRARLEKEARTLARISHPNVVTIHGVGIDRGKTYLAMALVDGEDLRTWAQRTPRSVERVVEVFMAAGEGLVAAHAAGVVHRDFKPSNVLIDRRGRVRVADFGIASVGATPEQRRDRGDFETQGAAGTPAFMAPEQYEGGTIGPAADQFALCSSIVDVLTGSLPYDATGARTLAECKAEGRLRAPDPQRVPARLWSVLRRGLAPEPGERWPDLRTLLTHIERAMRPPYRRFVLAASLGAVAVAATIAAFASTPAPAPVTEPDPCTGFAEQADALWDAPTRARIERAFAATGLDMAPKALDRAEARIDARLEGWVQRKRDTCRAAQAGELEPEQLDARERCLELRFEETARAVERFFAADVATVRAATELADPEPIETCDTPWTAYWLEREHPTGAYKDEADAIADRFDAAKDRARDGDLEAAVAAYDELIAHIDGTPGGRAPTPGIEGAAPSVRAELYRMRAKLERDREAKSALLDRSVYEGLATHFVRASISALVEVADHDKKMGRLQRAREWIALGLAENRRYGRVFADAPATARWAPVYAAELYNNLGLIEQAGGRGDEALVAYEAAVDALEPVVDLFPVRLVNALSNIAEVHRMAGAYERALPYYDRAIASAEARLGMHHPTLALVLANRAAARIDMGRPALALDDLERSVAILENVEGPKSAGLVVPVINLGLVHQAREELDDAERDLRRGTAISAASLGPAHPFTAYGNGMIGAVVRDAGRPREALEPIEGAVKAMAAVFPNGHPLSASMLIERAETHRLLSDLRAAEDDARAALKMLEATNAADTPAFAAGQTVLGHVLVQRGRPDAAAKELDAAIALLSKIGPDDRIELRTAREVRAKIGGATDG